jgi:hypothetical protein
MGMICEERRERQRMKEAESKEQHEWGRQIAERMAAGTGAQGQVRQFSTGATRDSDEGKNDYEGFLSPLVLEAYGDYMTAHRKQSDGSLRDSDNWQKGMGLPTYMKSLLRHVLTAWKLHRGYSVRPERVGGVLVTPTIEDALFAVLFNAMGYLHERLTAKQEGPQPGPISKEARDFIGAASDRGLLSKPAEVRSFFDRDRDGLEPVSNFSRYGAPAPGRAA